MKKKTAKRQTISFRMERVCDLASCLNGQTLVDAALDTAGRVCVLAVDRVPERIDGMFVPTTTQDGHSFTCITVNVWQGADAWQVCRLPPQRFNYHYFRLLGDDALLVGARSRRSAGENEPNAAVFDPVSLKRKRRFFLGDGIQDVAVTADATIWTSYFDEGVFGDDPAGACGLCSWDAHGNPRYRYDNSDGTIADCYALNVVSDQDVWFYYYTDFRLAHLHDGMETRYEVPVTGSSGFAVSSSWDAVLFRGGYQEARRLYLCRRDKMRFSMSCAVELLSEAGEKLSLDHFSACGPAFIVVSGTRVYYGRIEAILPGRL